MSEIWDAYDRQFNKIENIKLIRGEVIPNGMYHLVCEIILKHTDGKFLLMQRALEKNHGGMWELTAGGSVLADETPIECAMRELYEETGIVAFNFQEIKRIVHDEHQSLYVEFLCNTNCDKDAVTLQAGETIDYMWVSKNTILKMGADIITSSRTLKLIQEIDI